ncbi:SRPBCC family protein [Streptomyces sp. NPDC001797]|uniref:SRPBCC family protein n=1 Tax=Streptomyces sp. NPDC001797 TaxID=3364610 RepID=UPI0036995C4C
MASTSVSRTLPVSPERVWQLIGGFGSLPDWLPYIVSSTLEEGGRSRRLANPEGDSIVEQLVAFNEQERSYSYAILEAPFPVTDYISTLRVHAIAGAPGTSEVQWSGRFVPTDASEDEAVALFTGIYSDGLEALSQAVS